MRPEMLSLSPLNLNRPVLEAAVGWVLGRERTGRPLTVALRRAERRFGVRHEYLREFLRDVRETDAQQEE